MASTVVPVSCGWSDIESWSAVWSVAQRDGDDNRSRFLNVFKDPQSRLHAWRTELPDSIRRRLEAFVRRHSLPVAIPGAGLPALSAAERWLARQADLLAIGDHCRRLASATARLRGKAA